MTDQMRKEFSAWYLAEVTESYGESVRAQAQKNLNWVREDGSFADPMLRLASLAWQASRESLPAAYTAVDMATAAADGFRDGAASRDTEIETLRNHVQSMIDQTTPLVPVPGDPMWSRRITIDELQTEAEALRKVATELRRWAMCENLHHDKRDQHEHDEPCKVLARIDAAMSKEVTP